MIKEEYERARKELKVGSCLSLIVRGNYGDYQVQGYLLKFENDCVYLQKGMAHHYKRIRSMVKIPDSTSMELSGGGNKP